ncbi:MAG: SIMPL domain-containing protein [Bacteroidota bacterium]
MRRLLALTALLAALPLAAQTVAAQTDGRRSIQVSGEALVQVAPDEVILRLGVTTYDRRLEAAKDDNDARVTAVLEALRRLGVEDDDLQTDQLSIQPRYESRGPQGMSVIVGYVMRRSVVATLGDIEAVDGALAAAIDAGANVVDGIDFRTTDLRTHRDRARGLALEAAREKAEAMAGQLGQQIGVPIRITETGGGFWQPRGGLMSQNVVASGPAGDPLGGPTSPGQIPIRATVSVTFELVAE